MQAAVAEAWAERRRRAAELTERWPFSAQVLRFYGAVLETQARIFDRARGEAPAAASLPRYVVDAALPMIRDVVTAQGPERLARGVAEGLPATGIDRLRWADAVHRWLSGQDLPPIDRFVARAATEPVLQALPMPATNTSVPPEDERRCPRCGGPPQLGILAPAGEDLVAPRRVLECARCSWRWPYRRTACAACGEEEASRLPIFSEDGTHGGDGAVVRGLTAGRTEMTAAAETRSSEPRFPHLVIHACRTCMRYLLCVDWSRDPKAVPVVDEIGAIPLALYASEQGFAKVVLNLMGL